MKKTTLFLVLIFTFAQTVYPSDASTGEVTTIILVRHAEPEFNKGSNPSLNEAGKARAQALVRVLRNVPLEVVYATSLNRAQETAKPVAESKGIPIITHPRGTQKEYQQFIDEIVEKNKGKTVLIVSHSNTVPAFIRMIRNETFNMDEIEYINSWVFDNLYIVSFDKREEAKIVSLKFGQITPPNK